MNRQLDIEVRDSVFDPKFVAGASRKVYVSSQFSQPFYKVWLYLAGRDLPYVQSVTYELHPTFPDPVRRVTRTPSNANCQLEIWTYGFFDVRAMIQDKSGNFYEIVHKLSYGNEIKNWDGIEVVNVEQDLRSVEQTNVSREYVQQKLMQS